MGHDCSCIFGCGNGIYDYGQTMPHAKSDMFHLTT